jgi:hypothetical protein
MKNDSKRLDPATVSHRDLNNAASLRSGKASDADDKANTIFSLMHWRVFHCMAKFGLDLFDSELLEPVSAGAVPPEIMMLSHAAVAVMAKEKAVPTAAQLEDLKKTEQCMQQITSSLGCHVFTRVVHCRDACKNLKHGTAKVEEGNTLFYKKAADAERIAHEATAVFMVMLKALRQSHGVEWAK